MVSGPFSLTNGIDDRIDWPRRFNVGCATEA